MDTASIQEQLTQVETAITTILAGGQSYKIGSRQLTRADLNTLRAMKKELEAELAASETSSNLLDDTYVAIFDGR